MKYFLFSSWVLTLSVLSAIPATCLGQKANPRGVYKLVSIVGKTGKIDAPFDQYKILSDSVTLSLFVRDGRFRLTRNDKKVFNYTGEKHESADDKGILIYDSNEKHFKFKWWSKMMGHPIFPENDWCTEIYESGQYSPLAKTVLDAVMSPQGRDEENAFVGAWRLIGQTSSLDEAREKWQQFQANYVNGVYKHSAFYVFTPEKMVDVLAGWAGPVLYIGKDTFHIVNSDIRVTWLSPDCMVEERNFGDEKEYFIFERLTDGRPVISHVSSLYLHAFQSAN